MHRQITVLVEAADQISVHLPPNSSPYVVIEAATETGGNVVLSFDGVHVPAGGLSAVQRLISRLEVLEAALAVTVTNRGAHV